jgi:hypothetical protein
MKKFIFFAKKNIFFFPPKMLPTCASVSFIICFIIGLPCILKGCNELICPLENLEIGIVVKSNYVVQECSSYQCLSYSNKGTICTNQIITFYDCSYWETLLKYQSHEKNQCFIRGGPYTIGTSIGIFVNHLNGNCNANLDTIKNLPYVGIVFLVLSGLFLIILTISCFDKMLK